MTHPDPTPTKVDEAVEDATSWSAREVEETEETVAETVDP